MESKRFPVVEVFGPTIQGEGADQGVPCHFVRLGGCDYRCDWCDTPFAVLPDLVRQAQRLTSVEIVQNVRGLTPGPTWVVLSGGNPALHDLEQLVSDLHDFEYKVSVETQGTAFKVWLQYCDRVAVSPKPPSSGHNTSLEQLGEFLRFLHPSYYTLQQSFLKVVVLDEADYQFAKAVHKAFPEFEFFLSACNDAGATVGNPSRIEHRSGDQIIQDLIGRGRWLVNRTMVDTEMADVRVQVQNHVLYWGNERGR